jgi:hypothetical protein
MTPRSPAILEQLIRDNELGWMIDMYSPPDRAIPFLIEQLTRLTAEFRNRFGYEVSFAPEQLRAEAARNPHKIRAFLQALAASGSMDMLLMVWRILQGLSIREVTMNYVEQEAFRLVVTLARPGQDQDDLETYSSDDINDAALLRHFGITTVDGRPLFDGFFPLRKK